MPLNYFFPCTFPFSLQFRSPWVLFIPDPGPKWPDAAGINHWPPPARLSGANWWWVSSWWRGFRSNWRPPKKTKSGGSSSELGQQWSSSHCWTPCGSLFACLSWIVWRVAFQFDSIIYLSATECGNYAESRSLYVRVCVRVCVCVCDMDNMSYEWYGQGPLSSRLCNEFRELKRLFMSEASEIGLSVICLITAARSSPFFFAALSVRTGSWNWYSSEHLKFYTYIHIFRHYMACTYAYVYNVWCDSIAEIPFQTADIYCHG